MHFYLQSLIDKLKDSGKAINAVFSDLKLLHEYVRQNIGQFDAIDLVYLDIVMGELLRKQGCLEGCIESLTPSLSTLLEPDINLKSKLFPYLQCQTKVSNLILSVSLNLAVCYIQLRMPDECLAILEKADPFLQPQNDDTQFMQYHDRQFLQYQQACLILLKALAMAALGDFHTALDHTLLAVNQIESAISSSHTVLATSYNTFAIMSALNSNVVQATAYFDKALSIYEKSVGIKSANYIVTVFNKAFVSFVHCHDSCREAKLSDAIESVCEIFPVNHPIHSTLKTEEILFLAKKAGNSETMMQKILWDICFLSLQDHPMSWLDYPPVSKLIILGADHQVWAHLDHLKHAFPLRYSWISFCFLGAFHKLSNLHEKVFKRYGKFHIQKHAAAFLDDPTPQKTEYLLKMKDFDSCNEFYIHDVISGLIELKIFYEKCRKELGLHLETANNSENESIRNFCNERSDKVPGLKIACDYLLRDGLAILALLEAQKFGDFELDTVFSKIVIPLQFTCRGTYYGPALINHMKDLTLAKQETKNFISELWVANKSDFPGHCRPQDQNLEALFNNSAKNCFKLGTVQNVLHKSALIQERESCHQNLKSELSSEVKKKERIHRLRPQSLVRLRACWNKGFNELLLEIKDRTEEDQTFPIHSFNDKSILLNNAILKANETGEDRVKKFIAVKISQINGWQLQNLWSCLNEMSLNILDRTYR